MKSVDYEGALDTQGGGRGLIRKCKVQPGGIPAISKPLDDWEGNVYRALQDTPLREVIPAFYGIHEGSIIIGDVTAGFHSVCLADFKVGRRHYDPDTPPEKITRLIEKQQGSTTDSIGVRLIDAKVRKSGNVIRSWDRKQGLKFTEEELEDVVHAFIPQMLRESFSAELKKVRDAFVGTVRQLPGFRMYSGSVFVAYDGDAPKQIRAVLIDFAHTHLSLDEEGYDLGDRQFDDGVLDGIAALVGFAEARAPLRRGTTISAISDDHNRHKKIRRAVLEPGGQRVILRPGEKNEAAAYMVLQGTRIGERMPIFYGIDEGLIVVEDICGEFESPSIIDFRLSPASGMGGLKCRGGYICRNGTRVRRWERSTASRYSTAQVRDVYNEFVPKELAGQIAGMIRDIKRAYENEVKETPGFRMSGTSLLIAYDGDDFKKTPRVVLNRFKHLRLDITQEGLQPNDCPDGFLDGLNAVLGLAREDSDADKSKCCLLL